VSCDLGNKNANRSGTQHYRGRVDCDEWRTKNGNTFGELDQRDGGTRDPRFDSCTKVRCKVLEYNAGAMTIATMPKIRPRTKYINGKYWHLRSNWIKENIYTRCVHKRSNSKSVNKASGRQRFHKIQNKIMGEEKVNIGAYLQGSVRKRVENSRT